MCPTLVSKSAFVYEIIGIVSGMDFILFCFQCLVWQRKMLAMLCSSEKRLLWISLNKIVKSKVLEMIAWILLHGLPVLTPANL
jgi:hypothetical protein